MRILIYAGCILLLSLPAASTLSDRVQTLVAGEVARIGGGGWSGLAVQKRAALLRRALESPDALERMDDQAITALFGAPHLRRREGGAQSWHYISASCAVDLYFKDGAHRPAYVEYRLGGQDLPQARRLCVRALFSAARGF